MKKVLSFLAILGMFACSSAQVHNPASTPPVPDKTETVLVCVDDNNETLTCDFDTDCCEGFVCVDKADSHYRKECIQDSSAGLGNSVRDEETADIGRSLDEKPKGIGQRFTDIGISVQEETTQN